MCGEQLGECFDAFCVDGSPPRVRGTEPVPYTASVTGRITPACAGNRNGRIADVTLFEDHPRVCGEQPLFMSILYHVPGSPPRVRGTDIMCRCRCLCHRITPACAGNSLATLVENLICQDHPRVCGEQSRRALSNGGIMGSPPRVRGTGR